jgi:hypothetical protein
VKEETARDGAANENQDGARAEKSAARRMERVWLTNGSKMSVHERVTSAVIARFKRAIQLFAGHAAGYMPSSQLDAPPARGMTTKVTAPPQVLHCC